MLSGSAFAMSRCAGKFRQNLLPVRMIEHLNKLTIISEPCCSGMEVGVLIYSQVAIASIRPSLSSSIASGRLVLARKKIMAKSRQARILQDCL